MIYLYNIYWNTSLENLIKGFLCLIFSINWNSKIRILSLCYKRNSNLSMNFLEMYIKIKINVIIFDFYVILIINLMHNNNNKQFQIVINYYYSTKICKRYIITLSFDKQNLHFFKFLVKKIWIQVEMIGRNVSVSF